jgi:hypothetical protein
MPGHRQFFHRSVDRPACRSVVWRPRRWCAACRDRRTRNLVIGGNTYTGGYGFGNIAAHPLTVAKAAHHLYDDSPPGVRRGLLDRNGKPKPGYHAYQRG